MSEQSTPTTEAVTSLAEQVGQHHQVFGEPIQQGKTTLVPVAHVRAGGGLGGRGKRRPDQTNGGMGLVAWPVGAWAVHEDGATTWHSAVSVNRIVLGGQLVFAAAVVGVAALIARRGGARRRCR